MKRFAALVLALVAACTTTNDPTIDRSATTTPPDRARSSEPPAKDDGTRPAPGATGDPRSTVRGGQPVAQPPPDPYADDAGVGGMAKTYLRGSPATRLTVELDYVGGRRPSQSSLEHIGELLRRECDKREGVRVALGDEIAGGGSPYTPAEIAALERTHRDRRSADGTATLWIVFLDGRFEESGSLGVALTASTAAVFPDEIDRAASALVLARQIERSVLTHEVGHLLGLVNIVFESPHDHEDPDHPKHSRYRDSVMFWAIEDISVSSILGGGPPDDFDPFDRDDLRILRES